MKKLKQNNEEPEFVEAKLNVAEGIISISEQLYVNKDTVCTYTYICKGCKKAFSFEFKPGEKSKNVKCDCGYVTYHINQKP